MHLIPAFNFYKEPAVLKAVSKNTIPLCFFLLAALLLCHCAGPAIIVQHAEPGYTGKMLSNQPLQIAVEDDVKVLEFRKTFAKRFGSGENFAGELYKNVCAGLAKYSDFKLMPPNTAPTGTVADAPPAAKYLLKLTEVTVANDVHVSGGTMMMNAGGGMTMTPGSRSESCVVSFDAELTRAEDGKELWKVNVTGKAGVFLFAFETALLDATDKCVTSLCNYVSTGVVE